MIPGISTQVFLPRRMDGSLLDAMHKGGARAIELWAARWHVDYTDRTHMRELAAWFKSSDVLATMHAPLSTDTRFSRHASSDVSLVNSDRGRRIAAMDETKRALEMAEQIPVKSCVLHLGAREDRWSEYVLEYCLTAVEHLKAFAGPLGVQLLLENLPNDVATPEHLLEVLRAGHFDSCGLCLDVGHVHLGDASMEDTFALVTPRLRELHLSDNDGVTDAHLWPASGTERPDFAARGTIDWAWMAPHVATLPAETVGMFEIADTQARSAEEVTRMLSDVLSHRKRLLEEAATKPVRE